MSKKTLILGPLFALLALVATFVISMRLKFRPVQDQIRKAARNYANPKAMETAGQPGDARAIVRHSGRSSGKPYETPVETVPTEDGFVIALPYGTNPDWLKNVMAAGSAVVVSEGKEHPVEDPELVSGDAGNRYFPQRAQTVHRIFGTDDFLRLRHVSDAELG